MFLFDHMLKQSFLSTFFCLKFRLLLEIKEGKLSTTSPFPDHYRK